MSPSFDQLNEVAIGVFEQRDARTRSDLRLRNEKLYPFFFEDTAQAANILDLERDERLRSGTGLWPQSQRVRRGDCLGVQQFHIAGPVA